MANMINSPCFNTLEGLILNSKFSEILKIEYSYGSVLKIVIWGDKRSVLSLEIPFVLFALGFYGPVNNQVMSSQSVNSGTVPGQD